MLSETVRLHPPVDFLVVQPVAPTLLGGKYHVKSGKTVMLSSREYHADPAVWGADARAFRPERWLDDKESAARPLDAFKAFGNGGWRDSRVRSVVAGAATGQLSRGHRGPSTARGNSVGDLPCRPPPPSQNAPSPPSAQPPPPGARACIGRAVTTQLSTSALALLLHRFDLHKADRAYTLRHLDGFVQRPAGFFVHLRPRHAAAATTPSLAGGAAATASQEPPPHLAPRASAAPLLVLHGGSSGTCEAFAQRIASEAPAHGFAAR